MKNCFIQLFALIFILISASCARDATDNKRPPILVLLLDTLRADHLGALGYERDTSPRLDAFAKENLFCKYAVTAAPWTPASVSSILTGLYPSSHGMMPPNDRELAKKGLVTLNQNLETLPELLKRQTYKTAAVSSNPWISNEFGFTQGFDQFVFKLRARADEITDEGIKLVDTLSQDGAPYFIYLHYLDPHDPYDAPGEYRDMFKGPLTKSTFPPYSEKMLKLVNRYDGEIRFLDLHLGRLFDHLKAKGVYDEMTIVILADHGEQFMEHGDHRHGFKLHNEEVHVPLFIKTGRSADRGRVIEQTVSTVDVLPTILDRLGLEIPAKYPGISLMNEGKIAARHGVFSEIRRVYDQKAFTGADAMKLILQVGPDRGTVSEEESEQLWRAPRQDGLYDAKNDYAELKPFSDSEINKRLRGDLDESYATAQSNRIERAVTGQAEIKDETLEELKSLGYLQ